ncbi:MAG: hydrogenase expression/formation protein HypE [Spartobacteria bacterium]|nr:hydrogenase expression/formation protein HypE [Spartobacteria bacterium]
MSNITLAHGGGGRLTAEFIEEEIVTRFGEGPLAGLPDAASLAPAHGGLLFSTDSFVVQPLFFPGGNIGDLAVHGTVNDLAVSGGTPRWFSLGLILEEGLPMETLRQVLDALKKAADDCGVQVVTGDTKVVRQGQCDGMYINTAGIGLRIPEYSLGVKYITPGDTVLVSGPLGDHGMAVLSTREGLAVQHGPVSDTGPVHRLVQAAVPYAGQVRFMRDPTRGGAAAVLNEMVQATAIGVQLKECELPFSPKTKVIAEMTGVDLLHVASEGRVIMVCAADAAPDILACWRALPEGANATQIGMITGDAHQVILETVAGGRRLVDVPRGELLPRIC